MARLTEFQRKQLNDYLLEKKPLITSQSVNSSEVAEWCREALKFEVSESNVFARVGYKGVLYKHNWPGSEGAAKGRASSKQALNLLLEQVNLLHAWSSQAYNEMLRYGFNVSPPQRVKELLELAQLAREGLAITDFRDDEEK